MRWALLTLLPLGAAYGLVTALAVPDIGWGPWAVITFILSCAVLSGIGAGKWMVSQ